jgi:hypothetical protein
MVDRLLAEYFGHKAESPVELGCFSAPLAVSSNLLLYR